MFESSRQRKIIPAGEAKVLPAWTASHLEFDGRGDSADSGTRSEIELAHANIELALKASEARREELDLKQTALSQWENSLNQREAALASLEQEARDRAHREAHAQAFEQMSHEKSLLVRCADEWKIQMRSYHESLAQEVLDLSLALARRVVVDSVTLHESPAAALLAKVLPGSLLNKPFTVYVSEADQAALKSHHLKEITGELMQVQVDPELRFPGELRVEFEGGQIDLSLASRFEQLTRVLGRHA